MYEREAPERWILRDKPTAHRFHCCLSLSGATPEHSRHSGAAPVCRRPSSACWRDLRRTPKSLNCGSDQTPPASRRPSGSEINKGGATCACSSTHRGNSLMIQKPCRGVPITTTISILSRQKCSGHWLWANKVHTTYSFENGSLFSFGQ